MSKYTTEVRYICEVEAGLTESVGYNDANRIIKIAAPKIFNFEYPIFSDEYKVGLQEKILRHFYDREIGFETVGLWKLHLQAKLNEIMPYYNKLYESELIKIDPLLTKNMDRVVNNVGGSQTSGTQRTINADVDWNLFNDTPQGGIDDIDEENYLTTARKQTSDRDSNNTYTSMNSNNDDTVENIKGFDLRSMSSLLKEYRETFLNIDAMILRDLDILFMQVW